MPRDGPFDIGGGGGRGKAKAKPVFKNTVRAGLYHLLFVSRSRSNLIEIIYCFFIFLNHMLRSFVFFKDYSCFIKLLEIYRMKYKQDEVNQCKTYSRNFGDF